MTLETKTKNKCKKCGSENTYWREEHPDTGMDEMVLVCVTCEIKKPKIPFSFLLKEKISIKFGNFWDKQIVSRLFRIARKAARSAGHRCTWCGSNPGFNSSYICGKGLRCESCKKYS